MTSHPPASPPAQVVPAPCHAHSYTSSASTPLSSPGSGLQTKLEVPWFALHTPASAALETADCYCDPDPEAELYPSPQQLRPLNLAVRKHQPPLRRGRARLAAASSDPTTGSSSRLLASKLPPRLPSDPRQWSRAEVCVWVAWTCSAHSLPAPALERFLMNGKAVCLMSLQMFSARVPLGGKLLYRDFQIRLARAVNNLKTV